MGEITMSIRKMSMLIIVDQYHWAWGIASRELLRNLPNVNGKIIDYKDFKGSSINTDVYDVVLVYPWYDSEITERLSPRNTIICVAGGDVLEGDMLPVFKAVYSKFMVFGAVSGKLYNQILEIGDDPNKRVTIITHGTDMELFKPAPTPSSEFTIGWAGRRDRPLKRFKMAKEIAARLGVSLTLATQPQGGHYIDHKKMPEFYNSINCLLVTSETEAHPLVVYEAMACGIPVVTTNVGDIHEFIITKFNGILLPIDSSVSEFVKAMEPLISETGSSSHFAVAMGKNARKAIVKRLSWGRIAPQYMELDKILRVTCNDYMIKNVDRIDWKTLKFKR